ncbi:putative tannase family protein [Teratosphaeria destructans]|uniref:Carboxylic ester hydrolase n=1 Tax=Teratosphaeria destructans TaxID=418781 RepID=A0A9W7T1W7_9PEZI|nr:putative tannase family protein [Teratosphaeria destructans]
MAAGVGYGFAAMSTDIGHNSTSFDLTWALNQPEKKIDFGYRAMHGSVVMAKQVIEAYYGCVPRHNYYSGCSTGGRQGLRDIQLYPDDFDGVLVGAPAWWTDRLQTWTVKLGLYNLPITAAHHIPLDLFPAIAAQILKQCDPQDGLVDNIISDPAGCNVDLEAFLCGPNVTNQTAEQCVTAAQIGTLHHIYNDYVETNQTFVFPHLELGSEAQWNILLGDSEPSPLGTEYVQDFVLNDATWNFWDFNSSIVDLAEKLRPGNATADEYDLSPFYNRGGKLLHYHGFADGLIPTGSSIYFYKQVLETLLPRKIKLDSWYRLFLVPGMQHCYRTPSDVNAPWYFAGANQAGKIGSDTHSVPGFSDGQHDALLALMAWVENGTAPKSIIATKWVNDTAHDVVLRQRPLCPFPKQAKYTGTGSPDKASSWACELLYDLRAEYAEPVLAPL